MIIYVYTMRILLWIHNICQTFTNTCNLCTWLVGPRSNHLPKEAGKNSWRLHGLSSILGRELQVDQSVAFEGSQHATHCTTPTTKGEEPMCKIDGTKFLRFDDCSDSTTYWSCIPGINGRHIMSGNMSSYMSTTYSGMRVQLYINFISNETSASQDIPHPNLCTCKHPGPSRR